MFELCPLQTLIKSQVGEELPHVRFARTGTAVFLGHPSKTFPTRQPSSWKHKKRSQLRVCKTALAI